MATTGKPTVPSMEVETGVPILKVMRLQKPDLHMVGYVLHLIVFITTSRSNSCVCVFKSQPQGR
jgi:hypothetical protein